MLANGDDIVLNYCDHDCIKFENKNYFAAVVEDSTLGKAFPIPGPPFNSNVITTDWPPADKCWTFSGNNTSKLEPIQADQA